MGSRARAVEETGEAGVSQEDGGPRVARLVAVVMIRIAITQAAFDAIARTMPFGSVNFEAGVDDKGERYIWLPRAVVDRLRSLRGPGESYSEVILRLAKGVSVHDN